MRVPEPLRMTLLPDGGTAMLINLGDPQKRCDGGAVAFQRSWISGAQPGPIELEISGLYESLGIAFRPGGAAPLFRFDMAELLGSVVELEDIWGARARELRESIASKPTDSARLRVLEAWLARVYRDAEPCGRTAFAARELGRGDLNSRVDEVSRAVGISAKQLVEHFRRRTGLSPKFFARVRRLQAVVNRVNFVHSVDWADVAADGGFYDQSHLIREFKALAGMTPGEFLERRTPYPGYLASKVRATG